MIGLFRRRRGSQGNIPLFAKEDSSACRGLSGCPRPGRAGRVMNGGILPRSISKTLDSMRRTALGTMCVVVGGGGGGGGGQRICSRCRWRRRFEQHRVTRHHPRAGSIASSSGAGNYVVQPRGGGAVSGRPALRHCEPLRAAVAMARDRVFPIGRLDGTRSEWTISSAPIAIFRPFHDGPRSARGDRRGDSVLPSFRRAALEERRERKNLRAVTARPLIAWTIEARARGGAYRSAGAVIDDEEIIENLDGRHGCEAVRRPASWRTTRPIERGPALMRWRSYRALRLCRARRPTSPDT